MPREIKPLPDVLSSPVKKAPPQTSSEAGGNMHDYLYDEVFITFLKSLRDAIVAFSSTASAVTSDVVPTVADIPEGGYRVWINTTTPDVRMYSNNAGTLVSVVLS